MSALSDEKDIKKFGKGIESISPVSMVNNIKKPGVCQSQNSNKFVPQTRFSKGGLLAPDASSPSKSYQAKNIIKKQKNKRKTNFHK